MLGRLGLAASRHQHLAADREPEALRRLDPRAHGHVRHRSCRHREDVPRRRRWPSPRSRSRDVSRLILTRPAVEAGERLGFLPGDIQAKVDPYLRPLFDALYDMLDPDRVNDYFERGIIEVAPLAFMRGRTLNDSFVILDEAQNTSPEQMKMFLTRLGFGSKMVRDRRRDPDRPAGQPEVRSRRRRGDPLRGRRHQHSSASGATTSSGIGSCSGSSPPTGSTASAAGRPTEQRAPSGSRATERVSIDLDDVPP